MSSRVYVVTITDTFGKLIKRKVFSSESLADHWIEEYVSLNWSSRFAKKFPKDRAGAVYEYFWSYDPKRETLEEGWETVDGGIKSPAVESLGRCAFLLHKIAGGDHRALENAEDAVDEAVRILKEMGETEEWFDNIDPEVDDE